eukprot:TRINITY_DN55112_c0_g1_i1.p1 TRINITY_DN55112_c0_g1~~TRINITY_DN55112_c0_g1_i1.p1  ORF type:complete len:917 (+),score=271.50 TRINITY_DN55112_c0_g1_i1:101-2851(+)
MAARGQGTLPRRRAARSRQLRYSSFGAVATLPRGGSRKANRVFGGTKYTQHYVQAGADKRATSIWWSDHVPEEAMPGYSDNWTLPESGVPHREEFGSLGLGHNLPPGQYPGVNRPWVGFKPSRWRGGYYGSGLALRDSWGPDMERTEAGNQARPETLLERVSVDWFLDEFAVPVNKHNSVVATARHKHTNCLKLNKPAWDNQLDLTTIKTLYWQVRQSTMAMERRLTMVGACQNGKTEWWCSGLPLLHLAHKLRFYVAPPSRPCEGLSADEAQRVERLAECLRAQRAAPDEVRERIEAAASAGADIGGGADPSASLRLLKVARDQSLWAQKREEGSAGAGAPSGGPPDCVTYACDVARWGMRLLWVLARGDSATLSFVNGRCAGFGSGLALLCNHAAVRFEGSFTFCGAADGLSPAGGLLRLLVSEAADLKYPGLAEYVVLTGEPLFEGDAKRLGWTSVHAPTDTHLNERMLQDYLNIHPLHDAGDGRRLMQAALFSDSDMAPELDRCAVTYERMEWVRYCFAGVSTVQEALQRVRELRDTAPAGVPRVEQHGADGKGEDIPVEQWADAAEAALLRGSPFALAVSLEMVRHAREKKLALGGCMALEYRCLVRMMKRRDFVRAQVTKPGFYDKSFPSEASDWDEARGRPAWEPAELELVSPAEVAAVVETPLDWDRDGTVELWLPVEGEDHSQVTSAAERLGMEVVEALGEDPSRATPDAAWLPRGVNVYRDARHPTTGVATSAREPAPAPQQSAHRRLKERAAARRIAAGQPRSFRRDGSPSPEAPREAFTETDEEGEAREARQRWDEMRVAAERACGSESWRRLNEVRVDPGGERVLSPGNEPHAEPFAARVEPKFGRIADYDGTSTLTHFYDAALQLPPRAVRNWPALEAFVSQQRAGGKLDEDISRMVYQADF